MDETKPDRCCCHCPHHGCSHPPHTPDPDSVLKYLTTEVLRQYANLTSTNTKPRDIQDEIYGLLSDHRRLSNEKCRCGAHLAAPPHDPEFYYRIHLAKILAECFRGRLMP